MENIASSGVVATSGRPFAGPLSGLANLFAWPLRASDYMDLLRRLGTEGALEARVESVTKETRDARTITLRPTRLWRGLSRHRAGQFARVGVFVDGRREVRTYTLSSAPGRADGCVTITVKAVPGGRVSEHLVRQLVPGDVVSLGLPEGEFVLPGSPSNALLFITAGSGITPVMSMLRGLAVKGPLPDIVHVHYTPTADDVIFGDELRGLARSSPGYRLTIVATRAGASAPAERLSEQSLDVLSPDWRVREAYACGPTPLLESTERLFRDARIEGRLHVERFGARVADVPNETLGGSARFTRSGIERKAPRGTSLLRVAEDAGLRPASGCRIGICHSCTATLVTGCVRDIRNNALTTEKGARVQICVSAAVGPVTLDL